MGVYGGFTANSLITRAHISATVKMLVSVVSLTYWLLASGVVSPKWNSNTCPPFSVTFMIDSGGSSPYDAKGSLASRS